MTGKLRGVVPPMITPFNEDGGLNDLALRAVVRFLSGYVQGLFICGTYGGGPLMSTDEKKHVIDVVTQEANGRVEVIVNVGATTNQVAVELAKYAESAGADRVASTPPFYYVHPPENVLRYFSAIVDAVAIPVYAYNNPKAVGYGLGVGDLAKLTEVGLFGVKDSSFDMMLFDQLRRSLPPSFDVVMGTEGLFLPASVLGCQAFVPGLGNAFPDLMRKLFDQAMAKQYEEAYETHKLVMKLRGLMSVCGPTLVGVTEMAWLRGINAGYPRPPFARADAATISKLRDSLVAVGVLEGTIP